MANSNMYKVITETVPEFFFVYHFGKKEITFVSPQFYELAKGPEQETHHAKLRTYVHPQCREAFDRFFEDLSVENDYTSRIELKTHENLGGIRWVEIYTFPVEEDGKEVKQVVGHIINITDKKERMQLLQKEHDKLDSVLKILAHDLRAPFSQVYMIADILKGMMSKEDSARYGSYVNMLQNLGNRSLVLLDNLLRLVSLQEGTLTLDLKKHDLRKMAESVVESFQVNFNEKDIVCALELPDFAVVAEVDRLLLEQALSNLLSNALKFTPNQGQVALRIRQEEGKAFIEVEDSGIGIPEEHVKDLFKEFSKIRRKGLKGEKSTGLGLAIAKQIARLHKGEIKVKSREKEGSTFILLLPLS